MKVTFPHMGTAHLAFATLLADLGLEPVVPPPTSQRTIALGVRHAPEFACFPLKVNLGNYLEALAAGAEAILMVGGAGPCRLGYYAEVQREILRGLGHDIELIALEPPNHGIGRLWRAVRRLIPGISPAKLARALFFALRKLAALDELERLAAVIRPREARRGEASAVWAGCRRALAPVTDMSGLRQALLQCRQALAAVAVEPERPVLRVALGGEVYMVLEPAVNLDLERVLGEQGVLVDRRIYLSSWINDQLIKGFLSRRWFDGIRDLARPYLGHFVGGHGLESVAQAVDAGVNRYDGLIQLAPFTCMPEIIAQSVLPRVGRNLDLPIMTLILDEHSGEAGVLTRVEAFLDLLRRRRAKEALSLAPVFSGR
ncbi:MAG: CoA protein activase [Patescibacteria group bacterium]